MKSAIIMPKMKNRNMSSNSKNSHKNNKKNCLKVTQYYLKEFVTIKNKKRMCLKKIIG